MINSRQFVDAAVLLLAFTGVACTKRCGRVAGLNAGREAAGVFPRPRPVQPGAPGESSKVVAARPATALKHTADDTAFMQGMIGHHTQAIEMVALLKTRTETRDMKLLGQRIEVSQNDEIRLMQTWLRDHGQSAPD